MSSRVLLFPGQGSQEPGMGRDIAEANRDAMDVWKKAERISGIALREIYWDGDEQHMAATQNLQPALTVVNYTVWRELAAKIAPTATAGHSLGEYSALAAAGVLPIDTVLELVSLRGKLMSQADPDGKGAMAAVIKLSLEQVQACITETNNATGETLVVANYNTPGQFVISGTRAAITHVQDAIKAAKGRAIPLAVSGAFHSPLMNEAARELASALQAIRKTAWNNARFSVYSNAFAKAEKDAGALKALLEKQMTSSVYWIDTMTNLWDDGCRIFIECGPKNVLSKMVAPILQGHAPAAAQHTDDAPAWDVHTVGKLTHIEQATF